MHWIKEIQHDISKIPSTPKDIKKFGVVVGSIFVLLSGLAVWKGWWNNYTITALVLVGCSLVLGGFFSSRILAKPYQYWMSIAIVLGSIVSRVILFILFFIVIVPTGLVAKLIGKKFLISYKVETVKTYWIVREKNKKINYEQMF
ncbi:MAG: SxtJ family membrane protein [Bacteroidota bacterium]|nr:SxtJ family membrane protein [Bacteroidota bacterium]